MNPFMILWTLSYYLPDFYLFDRHMILLFIRACFLDARDRIVSVSTMVFWKQTIFVMSGCKIELRCIHHSYLLLLRGPTRNSVEGRSFVSRIRNKWHSFSHMNSKLVQEVMVS